MACKVQDGKQFVMERPACQEIRITFQELFDDCEGDMRKLMRDPKQHILAKLVHEMRVFRDEDTQWLFDVQLDRFESNDGGSCGDVSSSDNDGNELAEVGLSQFGGLRPLEPCVVSGFFPSCKP